MTPLKKSLVVLALGCCVLAVPSVASAAHICCAPCEPCCAPPPPVEIALTLKDPCTCCTYEVCLCIPACCANEAPCITWRNGLFKRRVAHLTWKCCGHKAKVIVTRHGKVLVRD